MVSKRPDQIRLEELRQGVAAGLSGRQAAIRAGFSVKSNWHLTLLRRPESVERIAFLRRVHALSRDGLAPLIFALQEIARTAAARETDPALAAAVRALTEAGRMLEKLPAPPEPPSPLPAWYPPD